MTPLDFVSVLRRYIGVPHSASSSFIVQTPRGPKGFLRCVGLPLVALRDLGYLPADFSLDQSNVQLLALLHEHFTLVEDLAVGDFFFLRIESSNQKHIAIYTETGLPFGRYIHCLNDVRGVGRVWECDLDQGTVDTIESIYRLKIWVGKTGVGTTGADKAGAGNSGAGEA